MNWSRVPKRFFIEGVLLAALSVAVCLPWGCSGARNTATGPAWNSTFELPNGITAYPGTLSSESEPAAVAPTTGPIAETSHVVLAVDTVIGELGAIVSLPVSDSEVAFFTVPPGALEANTNIKAEVSRALVGMDRQSTQFEFGPDGLVFRIPALLTFKSAEAEGSTLDLEWWDPARALWVQSAEAVVVLGHATFPVLHFSTYRVVERVSLGGQQKSK